MYKADTPVRYIRKIGPTKAKELNKLGIHTVLDLLERQPLSYIFSGTVPISEAKEGMVVIKARIEGIRRTHGFNVRATLEDTTGTCGVQWYNVWHAGLHSGMTAIFYGKMSGGALQQPKWTCVEKTMESVYGGQYGTHHDTIRAALVEVLANVELPDLYTGWNRVDAFKRFHFPCDKAEQQRAEYDLKMDEAICLQTALAERRKRRESVKGEVIQYNHGFGARIKSYFPYDFTGDQSRAVNSILSDLRRTQPMQRLIHGEVGSGKSAVAFYAAMLAALNGKRTLILCPTTILADQHHQTLAGMGWDDVKLTHAGGSNETTGAHIIIGTHSILHADLLLKSASFVIIDEQQKFGVEQRAKLQCHHPHLLMLSATPIPRSVAATVFGDLDVSLIRELPIKRGTVITKWILPD